MDEKVNPKLHGLCLRCHFCNGLPYTYPADGICRCYEHRDKPVPYQDLSMEEYKIFCQVGARVVATLSMEGELTIYHDHFKDEENIDIIKFIEALDKWAEKRCVLQRSKRGLNPNTIEAINKIQSEKQ